MPSPYRVGLLLFPGCMPAGLFGFADLLHAANRRAGRSLFETCFIALEPGPVVCAHQAVLPAGEAVANSSCDALLVPGFWAESAHQVDETITANARLIAALAKRPARTTLWSYCVGVCLLAASGRLDDQPATVTWWLAEAMRQRYPRVRWQSEQDCILADRVATAAGVQGYQAIAQALIERHLHADAYQDLVRLMVLPRPARSHPAFRSLSLIEQASPLLRRLHALIERLPADRIAVSRLAEHLGVAERTLARKVQVETGIPVAAYARRLKLNQASERLLLTGLPVNAISAGLGFSSDANLRRMFKALTGLTPAAYRQQYGR